MSMRKGRRVVAYSMHPSLDFGLLDRRGPGEVAWIAGLSARLVRTRGHWKVLWAGSRGRRGGGADALLAQGSEHVGERRGGLTPVPRPGDPGGGATGLELGGGPQDGEGEDHAGEGGGAAHGALGLVLGFLEAEPAFEEPEGDLQGPPFGVGFQ